MKEIIAHRGESWRYPENSREAILSAYDSSYCDGVECDIRMTRDDHLVLAHDMKGYFTNRMFFGSINDQALCRLQNEWFLQHHRFFYYFNLFKLILDGKEHNDALLNDLSKLKRRNHGHILTLKEALEKLPNDKKLILEIKGSEEDYYGDIRKELLTMLELFPNKKIEIKGYNRKLMEQIKTTNPDLVVGMLINNKLEDIDNDLDFISINFKKIKEDPKLLDKCYKSNHQVYLWTLNLCREYLLYIQVCRSYGVFPNIITDNPELLSALSHMEISDSIDEKFIKKFKLENKTSNIIK